MSKRAQQASRVPFIHEGTMSSEVTKFQATTITAAEAAKLLGISKQCLYEAAGRGEVPSQRVGRRFIFVREALVQWLLKGSTCSK